MPSTSIESAFSQVNELLVEQACADSSEAKSHALSRARKILDDVIIDSPQNADLHHALGICWYHETEWSDEVGITIERCFRTALEAEPGHKFATLYLGHFCFDEKRYEEALALFSEVDESYFDGIGHHWRVLKNRELILCCRLWLKRSVRLSDIEDLCRAFEKADEAHVPVPREIVACLSTLRNDSTEELNGIVKRVLEMIRRTGFVRAKSISDGIKTLQESIKNDQDGI